MSNFIKLNLSIIIPVHQEEENLKVLIPYLLDFSSNKPEIIVVASNSNKDNSSLICKDYNVVFVKSKKKGRAIQMNEGASYASTSNLMFLHADVRPPRNYDQEILKALVDGKDMGFFSYTFDPTNKWLDRNAKYTKDDGLFAGGGDQIHFMTKYCFQQLNGYNERYVIMEDFDFIRRLRRKKMNYLIIDKPATVSSRKYQKNSYLKVNLVNLIAFLAFVLRVKPTGIKWFYQKALKYICTIYMPTTRCGKTN